jgi:DNA-binding NarL/FixJ family response regulator
VRKFRIPARRSDNAESRPAQYLTGENASYALWSAAADWPLVGRAEELEVLARLRAGKPPRSVVLNGAIGVGKSRLAREAGGDASRRGWATVEVRASAGLAGVPFGPLRKLMSGSSIGTGSSPSSLQQLAGDIEGELLALRSAAGLLLLVDDAHDLDDASAGLLHQLVSSGSVVAILTTRVGCQPPASVTDLWKDGFADRIELQPLSRRQTVDLVQQVLAGPLAESSIDRLNNLTGGNPLYVREVLLASLDSGALQLVDGTWRWRGEWASAGRLQEIVASRLSGLDPDELGVVEMLAVGGSLPLHLVEGLATSSALESLDQRGLIRIEQAGRRFEVSLTHAVHAEVTRSKMTPLQQRAVRRNLVDVLVSTPARRNDDRLMTACWSLELGLDVDPVALALGADALVFRIGHDFATRLDEIVGRAEPAGRHAAPAISDPNLARRLAQAAYKQTGRLAEGVGYARALAWTGAVDEADQVLAGLADLAIVDEDRVNLALARAWIVFWGQYDVEAAETILTAAIEDPGDCPPEVLVDAYQQLAGIKLNTARPAEGLAFANQAAELLGCDVSETIASPPAAACLTYLGRCEEGLAIIDRAMNAAHGGTGPHPLTLPNLLFTRAAAHLRLGRLEEARTLAETCRNVAIATDSQDGAALFGVLLGEILLRQGKTASAGRIFRDSSGLLAERDTFGYRPWALSGLARARTAAGDSDGAATYLALARSLQPIERHFDISLHLAESEICMLRGQKEGAIGALAAGLAWAEGGDLVVEEAFLLDALIRIEKSRSTAERLGAIAARTDSEIVGALARFAGALVDNDAEGMLAAADSLAGMTAWWYAAEAAAAAAIALNSEGEQRAAQAAARLAFDYGSNCEGGRTRFAAELSAPSSLTRREVEVARLAAEGLSNKQIADRLVLSARTVETHLQRAYVKLGVNDRAGLASILGIPA